MLSYDDALVSNNDDAQVQSMSLRVLLTGRLRLNFNIPVSVKGKRTLIHAAFEK